MDTGKKAKCSVKTSRIVELDRAVNRARHGAMLLVPVWKGRSVVVTYERWQLSGVTDKQRRLLLKNGWPEHMLEHGNWSGWGRTKLRTCSIQTALVESTRGLIPIAQYVREDKVHNALLQRNLLQGHGFPTDLGWYKWAERGSRITREFLQPSSNKFDLPAPVDWSILKL